MSDEAPSHSHGLGDAGSGGYYAACSLILDSESPWWGAVERGRIRLRCEASRCSGGKARRRVPLVVSSSGRLAFSRQTTKAAPSLTDCKLSRLSARLLPDALLDVFGGCSSCLLNSNRTWLLEKVCRPSWLCTPVSSLDWGRSVTTPLCSCTLRCRSQPPFDCLPHLSALRRS